MYNIRIKSLPENAKTGAQLNYALVDRNTLFLKPDMSIKSDIKTTETGVPRDEATIEAEGGEVRLSSTPDGYVKLLTIQGKSHAQGGEPIKAKPGDFIYSKTRSLKIKDPEVLKMFGMSEGKPVVPADIAKKYQLNAYVDILKDPKADSYSKNTAKLMLDNHIKKLGGLALVQESMKGFPDGIPAVAQPLMEEMQEKKQGEQNGDLLEGEPEQARYGGYIGSYQKGGTNPSGKKTIARKKEEGFWDNRGMPSWSQVGHAGLEALNAGTKAETYLGTGINALAHTGSWSGGGKRDIKGHAYGAKYMLPSELPSNAHLSRAAKIALDLAFDPINQFTLGTALAETATKRLATAGAEAALTLGEDMAKNTAKNKVSQEVAEAVVKSAGKNVNPRNIEIAKSAVAGASKKASTVTGAAAQGAKATAGAVKGAKWGAIGYDTRNVVEAANAPFAAQYKALEALHNIPIKQLPGAIAKGAVKGAKAVAKGAVALGESGKLRKGLTAAQSVARAAYNTAGTETIPEELTPEQATNVAIGAAGPPKPITSATVPTPLTTSTPITPEEEVAAPANRKRIYYDATQYKTPPASTKYVEYVPAQNSAEVRQAASAGQPTRTSAPVRQQVPVTPIRTQAAPPPAQEVPYTILPEEEYGGIQYGDLDQYQQGGPQNQPTPVGTAYDSKKRKNIVTWSNGTTTEEEPDITYDVADQDLVNAAKQRGYEMSYHKSAHLKRSSVPAQTRKTGFKVGEKSGFYENEQYPIGEKGLADFMEHWKDELQQYQGPSGVGPDAWKKDLFAQKGDEGSASKYIVNKANALGYAATGRPQVDVTQRAAYKPGIDVFNLKKFTKTPGTPETPETPIIPPARPVQITQPTRRDWWLQDKINLAGIMGDRVRKYGPTMGHFAAQIPDYALEDPAMLNQLALSQGAKIQDTLLNTTAGNVAGAGAINAYGQGLSQAAENQAGIQNRNIQTYNNASNIGAQIANQNQQLNQSAIQKYITENAIANQQYDNARRNQKWQTIAALNNGITNFQRINMQEDELTPGTHIDPDTGRVTTVAHRTMFNPDGTLAYDPRDAYGYGAGSNAGIDTDTLYKHYASQGLSPEDQERRVNARLKAYGLYNTAAAKVKKGVGYPGMPGGYGAQAFNPYGEEEQG